MITTDALVDGTHFRSTSMAAAAIGHRAMAANLSDVAAMGARPVLATVALGLAPDQDDAIVLAVYEAMAALAARHGVRIAGGDIVRAPVLTLAITVVGEVAPARLARRDGGRPHDVLAVTGELGASRAGLALLERPDLAVDAATAAAARAAFGYPEPRVAEGRWLAASTHLRAMMDLSDGLAPDLERMTRASGCGAELGDVPVAPCARTVGVAAGDDPEAYALAGGEDFELLVAVAPRAFTHLALRFEQRFGRPLHAVGTLTAEPGLLRAGVPLAIAGFDHRASRSHPGAREPIPTEHE